ncbi:uncharacterized protein BX664DRAFT_339223 [Halteromyces radiatus]|uniref:uncharacterized protein n=1 Tax=Halteromyces radiatus TaxID=101107 RepID=UPI00221EF5DA|nr:uncharacterized protein BX664DRAFT_339223 [Halteromyces radiatus]KAI8082854.1 hypothetical protein BX664DRAFT_339223 [Halteromyces radiatus]
MSLSSYDSGYSSVGRLEQFRTQHELARNFYDDVEFCPLLGFDEVAAHRTRIQQRSPYSSPRSSPPVSYSSTPSPPKLKAIPIINPENMTPVSILQQRQQLHHPQQQRYQQDSPPLAHWQAFHDRSSSPSSTSSSSSSSSILHSRVIPIINPSTGQPLLRQTMYDVTVR